MDSEPDQYEEQLKEVFDGFDASGAGALSPDELAALCYSLQLGEATPTLLGTLLQDQDQDGSGPSIRVDFHQFKNALIQVLSSTMASSPTQCPSTAPVPPPPADSPEIQPKFMKGSKRYGRRSTPEFSEPLLDYSQAFSSWNAVEENAGDDDDDEDEESAVPRKRERCDPVHETSMEEYEAEGTMTLWNPDEPTTPRGSVSGGPLSLHLELRLQEACDDLGLPADGPAGLADLLGLADRLGLEVTGDVIQSVREAGGEVNVREFVGRVVAHSQPPTPSSSTPYRQLKRLHSTQPFDEAGRRMTMPSLMTSSIGLRLFSTLDDGTGHAPVENLLDAWLGEGIENTSDILKALDFSLEGRVNLGQLTSALENELLVTRNGLHQAALASFKAEIRHLLERLDLELQEKERLLLDLETAERLKSQLAAEVDENHASIEHSHHLNLRKLEQEHKEKLGAVRSVLLTELDQIQQQASLQREELEAELEKTRADESFMRDHLSISIRENRRLESEVLEGSEQLATAQVQISKLQASLENVLREKMGDQDPGGVELLQQEERFRQLCSGYETQCRELQDRIDELQAEQALQRLGRRSQACSQPLADHMESEMESQSPGMESDPGLGTEEGQPFNMSLEAELMLEQLKEQHSRRVEDLQAQLESKIQELDQRVEEERTAHQGQQASTTSLHQEEVEALREQMARLQAQAGVFQGQLEQAALERDGLERRQAEEKERLELRQEEEVAALRQRLLEAHTQASDLEEQLAAALEEARRAEEVEELRRCHAQELGLLQETQEARLEEERRRTREEVRLLEATAREEEERRRLDHEEELGARLEEARLRSEEEKEALGERLAEEWRSERAALEEQSDQTLQEVLEAGMLRLVKEQEEKESRQRAGWEEERGRLQRSQEEALLAVLAKERLKLQEQQEQRERRMREAWGEEKLQLEEDYEGMLQERLKEEREKAEEGKEEEERRFERMLKEETSRLEERHREALKELSARHGEEREELGGALDRLREEVVQERTAVELHFSQRLQELEGRFSGDQDTVEERFQVDVSRLEQHYQAQLGALSASHAERALAWRAEMEAALVESQEQRRLMREALEQERLCLHRERAADREELENARREEVEAARGEKRELERQLDELAGSSQTKERDLSRQLIELHRRLQESQAFREDLLAASERTAQELEVLLGQAVKDFKQERAEFVEERAELQSRLAQVQGKYREELSLSEERSREKMEQFDALRNKIEDLETTLQQDMEGFEFERMELIQSIALLEDDLKDNLCCLESLDNERMELVLERDQLKIRIREMGKELDVLSEVTKSGQEETTDPGNMLVTEPVNPDVIYLSFEVQEPQSHTTGNTDEDNLDDDVIGIIPGDSCALGGESEPLVDEEPNTADMSVTASIECSNVPNEDVEAQNLESTGQLETTALLLEEHHENHLEMRAEKPVAPGECPEDPDCVVVDEYDEDVNVDDRQDSPDAMDSPKTSGDDLQEQSSEVQEEIEEEESPETFGTEGSPHGGSLSKHNTDDSRVAPGTQSVDVEEEMEQITEGEAAPSPDVVGHEEEQNSGGEAARSPDMLGHDEEQLSGGEAAPSPDEAGHEEETAQISVDEAATPPEAAGCEEETAQLSGGEAAQSPDVAGNEEEQIAGDEAATSPEAAGLEEDRNPGLFVAVQSWDPENNPEDGVVEELSHPLDQRLCHAVAVDLVAARRAADSCGGPTSRDGSVGRSPVDSHKCGKRIQSVSQECGFSGSLVVDQQDDPERREDVHPVNKLQVLYSDAMEENTLLHQKVSLLHQKTVTLESILTYNRQKIRTGSRALEENLTLRLKLFRLTKRAEELETEISETADLRVRYHDGRRQNTLLKGENGELKRRLSSLEGRLRAAGGPQGQHRGLAEELSTMRRDNLQLSELVRELELQGDGGLLEGVGGLPETAGTWETTSQGTSGRLEARSQADATRLEVCCEELEVQNADLRGALASLQGEAWTLSEWMQVHR
ncbi:ninein isoform X1 [Gadus morhua]|uniref:ninein isoform X1 n=1 Tax=Gadus morhua TaxID=8049 RepID=UPI0011B52EF8|nr:ninein isoform X1 [Gadus morhua]